MLWCSGRSVRSNSLQQARAPPGARPCLAASSEVHALEPLVPVVLDGGNVASSSSRLVAGVVARRTMGGPRTRNH